MHCLCTTVGKSCGRTIQPARYLVCGFDDHKLALGGCQNPSAIKGDIEAVMALPIPGMVVLACFQLFSTLYKRILPSSEPVTIHPWPAADHKLYLTLVKLLNVAFAWCFNPQGFSETI